MFKQKKKKNEEAKILKTIQRCEEKKRNINRKEKNYMQKKVEEAKDKIMSVSCEKAKYSTSNDFFLAAKYLFNGFVYLF